MHKEFKQKHLEDILNVTENNKIYEYKNLSIS